MGPFSVGIVSVHNVGLLVNLRLGNKSHLAFVRGLGPLALVRSTWNTPAPVPTAGNRGYLPGLSVIVEGFSLPLAKEKDSLIQYQQWSGGS